MTILPRLSFARTGRFDRSRRFRTVVVVVCAGLATAATVAGMIYMYYRSTMPRM
ncbi:MAG: hypothetical protein HOP33_00300 [Verrucomicrobia bacterium]|nr:hypothetical protein [Verrucomicrobiota bacterium]